jgi:hypothetical protein
MVRLPIIMCHFQARSQNCEKRPLALSCLSIPLPVGPSVRTEQLGFHLTDFPEMRYLSVFRNRLRKFKFN